MRHRESRTRAVRQHLAALSLRHFRLSSSSLEITDRLETSINDIKNISGTSSEAQILGGSASGLALAANLDLTRIQEEASAASAQLSGLSASMSETRARTQHAIKQLAS